MELITVPDALGAAADAWPQQAAVSVWGGASLTYRQLDEQSDAVAAGIAPRVAVGERVALLFAAAEWCDFSVAYFGVLKAGGVAVVLAPALHERDLAARIADTGAVGVLTAGPTVAVAGGWCTSVADAAAAGRAAPRPPRRADPDAIADVVFTSGTEGRARGVASTHRNLLAAGAPPATWRGGRLVHSVPPWVVMGTQGIHHLCCRGGLEVVAVPRFDSETFVDAASSVGATVLLLVPAVGRLLLGVPDYTSDALADVRAVLFFGAASPPELLASTKRRLPRALVLNIYGLTEAGATQTLMAYDETRPTAVGRPAGRTRVRIVDEEGCDSRTGDVGEIWLWGPESSGRSYWPVPDSAEAAAGAEGWVRTGDLGRLDADGYLYIVDRKKDVIVVSGQNVPSRDVEDVLREHEGVEDAAVFALDDDVTGEQVAAALVVRPGTSKRDIVAFSLTLLPGHMAPTRVFAIDKVPTNNLGKPLKRDVRAAAERGALLELH